MWYFWNSSRKKKTKKKRSIYVNPDSSSDSDTDGEKIPKIKNPPSTSTILKKYFNYNRWGDSGEVVYWEWKAG